MRNSIVNIFRTRPIFLFLLPVFFVLHGCMENYDFVPFGSAVKLAALYIGASIIFCLLFWLLYRNWTRAALAAFPLMAFNFFFGVIHDLLQKWFAGTFIVKYSFILPASAILIVLFIILIKKRKSGFSRLKYYLNTLLVLLILLDAVLLMFKQVNKKPTTYALPQGLTQCDTCTRPDIYFILADEYAGDAELKNLFHFDNASFQQELSKRGFHTIPDSYSNYNYTPFAVASILNMEYLQLSGTQRTSPDLTYCYERIRDNRVLRFLQHHGYAFYNHSVFDFEGQPKHVLETFLPAKTRLITAQTFINRFNRDIRFNLLTRLNFKSDLRLVTYANKKNNENIIRLTKEASEKKSTQPKFVYTHLMMPHYPYYYDKDGKERPFEELVEGKQIDQAAYIGYLQYSNGRLLELIDHIRSHSQAPPIIILMGDHGFRHFTAPVEHRYYFLNHTSVYLPTQDYPAFRDSLGTVNFFRAMLNTQFGQHLEYLKDSTSYLQD